MYETDAYKIVKYSSNFVFSKKTMNNKNILIKISI